MGSKTRGLVASASQTPNRIDTETSVLERIAYYERLSSIVKNANSVHENTQTETAERLQSSACFDTWAMPDPDPFGESRH